jgi:hypothetical protein
MSTMSPQLAWHGLGHSLWWQAFIILAVVFAAVMICMLYRYERRLVAPSVGNVLLMLRLMVLTCLFLTFLEPTVTWTHDIKRNGRIVVALDVSDSMTTADTHALPSEKLRWARALGIVGDQSDFGRITAWQAAYDNLQEPEWVGPNETADPERRARLTNIRKKNLEQAMLDAAQIPRKEIARRLLTLTNPPLLPALEKLGKVQIVAFGGKSHGVELQGLAQTVAAPSPSLHPGASDLSQPLANALSTSEGESILGVVLLTDGRDNAGHDPAGLASRLGNIQAPVFPVLLGSRLKPKDLGIGTLDYPQTVFKNDKPVLKANLHVSGFEGQPLVVKLTPADGPAVTRTITPAGPHAEVSFPLPVHGTGRHEFTLSVDPQSGETRQDNNSQQLALTVVDDKVRVLVLEGEARWEFRYLDNALKRDPHVELYSVVFDQPFLGLLEDTFFPRSLTWPAAPDLADSPLANADLVVIGDIASRHLPPQAWPLLEKFVSDGGGTLVLTAGKRHHAEWFGQPEFERLLPVTQPSQIVTADAFPPGTPTERGFHLLLTPEAESEAMFQFNTDPVLNRGIWAGLPGHMWGLIGAAKPGTTVFATARSTAAGLDLEKERQQAIIVRQYYGQGQVLWLGIDSTWRWRHLVGDMYHHRFWAQLGRWAAHNKSVAGNAFVKFGPDRPDVELGQDVLLRARWTGDFLKRFPQLKARVEIRKDKDSPTAKPFSTLELRPVKNQEQVFEAHAVSLPAGSYRAKLVTEQADLGTKDISANLYVTPTKSAELSDLSSNRDLLLQLAQLSNGQLVLPENVHKIPDLIRGPTASRSQRDEVLLWDHWLILTAFFILLMAEWLIRKMNGLP